MTSLPVFATIGTAYRFLVREFVTVVRLAWFPLLVVAVVQYFAAEAELDGVAARHGAEGPPMASPFDLVHWVVQIIAFAIVAVSIHRVILFDDRKPGQYIAFAFGRSEFLFMVLQVIVFAGYFLVGLVWAIAMAGQPGGLAASPTLAGIVASVLIVVAMVYLCVRLALIYPIVIAENRLDFRQSFDLTHGQFWRLLSVFALAMLPLGCAVGLAEGIFLGVLSRNFAGGQLSTEQMVEIAKGLVGYQVAIFYVIAVIASGLTVALLCYSYKALRGLRPDELLTPEYQVRP